uniref:CCHC-type domain-containing protein n=1 Tax=Takifugu rubripes TaxID=31033 RepID=A0A674N9F6_TAKRU
MVVVFVGSTDEADRLVAAGVTIRGENTPVFPLSNPARSVIVSNVPPFIKNETLLRELSRHGRIASPMKYFVLGTKSPLLRHVVSFRRHVVMVLDNNEKELDLALCFRVDGFDYTVYVTTESQKCFGCGEEGHLVRSCPNGVEARRPADPPVSAAPRAHDEEREAAQTTRGDMGPTAEVEESAGPQGDHPGDHRDLQNKRLTGEMVERTVPRTAETVQDMEDSGVEESSLSVPTKRKSKDTKVNIDKVKKLSARWLWGTLWGTEV